MRVLRALTLMLLMLHVVPVGAMRTDGPAMAGHDDGVQCDHASTSHRHHRDSCGRSSAATCCEGVSCASFGAPAVIVHATGMLAQAQRTPAGPRAKALLRTSSPETPPPKA